MTSSTGLHKALMSVRQSQMKHPGHVMLWCAIPCTGGSQWYRINRRFPTAREKRKKHLKLFHKLWSHFVTVAEFALRDGCCLAIEWPQSCEYWGFTVVKEFLKSHGLKQFDFDGCMYGLTSSRNESFGLPLKKPWSIASNFEGFAQSFSTKCDGSHEHGRTSGSDAVRSGHYTDSMASLVHETFSRYVVVLRTKNDVLRTKNASNNSRLENMCMPCGDIHTQAFGTYHVSTNIHDSPSGFTTKTRMNNTHVFSLRGRVVTPRRSKSIHVTSDKTAIPSDLVG